MRGIHFRRPTTGTTVAFVALIAALSGTAAALPGTATVDSGDIKNKQVKRSDLANNAVTSAKVKNGALLKKDFKSGQLPAGPKGDKGDKGATGASGPSLRWALVNSAGTILAQSGGITIAARPFTGHTRLDFGTRTAGHGMWAVASGRNNWAFNGPVTVAPCGTGPDVSVHCPGPAFANHLYVTTHIQDDVAADRDFYVYFMP